MLLYFHINIPFEHTHYSHETVEQDTELIMFSSRSIVIYRKTT